MNVLCNGEPVIEQLSQSRALHYGDGVFRTLLAWKGELLDAERQWCKLAQDARALDLESPEPALLDAEARFLLDPESSFVIKVLLTRASAGRGYAPATQRCDRWMFRYPVPQFSPDCWTAGVSVVKSPVRLSAQPLLAGIKHLNRLEQVLASRGWPEGVAEAILCDDLDAPVCGTRSNLFWVREGRVYTPALTRCGVAGMMRQRLLDLITTTQLQVQVKSMAWSEFTQASEAFISNSLIGIWPLREIDGRALPAPGPVTRQLMGLLNHPRLAST